MLDTTRAVPTPEGIELVLRLAGPVPRALAWLIDTMLRLAVLLVAGWLLAMLGRFGWGVLLILAFLLEWLAPAAFEVWADGSTPGKKSLGLMVLHDDGTPVGWAAALVRNLLRAIDFLPVGYGFGLVAASINRDFKRLGDIAAGTVVVYRDPAQRPVPIPAAAPVPPLRPLSLEEHRAVLDFAERAATLTPQRAQEIAELASPITGVSPQRATQRLLEVASFLSGRK
ncbi:MAG: RDD family protein [Burkholderiales bacterium]|nr:RDD family protein [Burkholderiales bacterium]